ncbi:three-Cys-motif partner protein TcmP [Peribacillus simplex]|uniref:Three-Cys-motif partner protein TcmP n=2 Tax=Peribacillus TaxID=2675229 RepID=A0AA90PIQ7_9BACI|nr:MULTISPECIES: three-Cys-motif partner protein TcmP [Peribacillus]MBD8587999.1 three-Cys-motif partner protein TcmP [Peribacillus simplex]MDP1421679.1 three-Cys-motif partner protein TcmP [Peribacillus simplex]MDP1454397.1 three-Cys-motif partner protein TcmP [Peribacillus frigoritolerans]MEA3575344.1 three-Cys-motif partner protein TcmP [Peribacillus frigoritolerans]
MSNDDFFFELQKHSEAKLMILDNYVVPWMRKITMGPYGERALVIDGFAGTGKYSNSDGSSIRLIKHAIDFCEQAEQNNWNYPKLLIQLIEGNEENYNKLLENIHEITSLDLASEKDFIPIPDYPSIQISCRNGNFDEVLSSRLDELKSGYTLIPSFCFIDPFGFKDTPFDLIKRYLSNDKSEILLNFIYEETNRFITAKNQKVLSHMKKHFGIEEIQSIQDLVQDKKPQERKQTIVDFYSRQLLENSDVNHVLTFEIKKSGRTKLMLFYGTKSIEGLKVMKKAMWKVDDTGMYMFDDRKNLKDIEFQFTKDLNDSILIEELCEILRNRFSGEIAHIKEIEEFVLTETIFPLENFCRPALKLLEQKNEFIDVKNRARKGTYPKNTVIQFK